MLLSFILPPWPAATRSPPWRRTITLCPAVVCSLPSSNPPYPCLVACITYQEMQWRLRDSVKTVLMLLFRDLMRFVCGNSCRPPTLPPPHCFYCFFIGACARRTFKNKFSVHARVLSTKQIIQSSCTTEQLFRCRCALIPTPSTPLSIRRWESGG